MHQQAGRTTAPALPLPYLLEILLLEMLLCLEHLNRLISVERLRMCFWLTPELTRLRQSLKLFGLRVLRIKRITSFSDNPN